MMVERACVALQTSQENAVRESAEKFLVEFRASKSPYSICKHVLDKSGDPSAQFHAISACRDAILREWEVLDPKMIHALRDELLMFAANRTATTAPYVSSQVLHCIAVMFKRGFLADPENLSRTLFTQVNQLLQADIEQKGVAMSFSLAVLEEFASASSSSIGINMAFHINAQRAFETHCLPSLVMTVVQLLSSFVEAKSQGHVGDAKSTLMVKLLCKVVDAVLTWEFQGTQASEDLSNRQILRALLKKDEETSAATNVVPGPRWTAALIQSNLLEMLFTAYSLLRKERDEDMLNTIRKWSFCIVSILYCGHFVLYVFAR
jgi:hypothetical protein